MNDPASFERQSLLAAQSRILDDGSGNVDYGKSSEVLAHANVPQRLHAAYYDTIPKYAREQLSDVKFGDGVGEGVGVRITGPARSGKSWTAAALLQRAAVRGFTIAWRTADELTEANYESVRGSDADQVEAQQERWFLQSVVEVLVIDNLDVLVLTDFSARHVLSIVRARADNGLFTIITSPLLPVANAQHFHTVATLPAISLQTYLEQATLKVSLIRAVS